MTHRVSHTRVRVEKETLLSSISLDNTADDRVRVILVSLRPTLAHRCSEGAEAAGEGVRGSAALPAKRRSI